MKKYQRDYRPLLGDRMQDFANHVGIGEIDATICDIHLVDDYGNYLGRPILTILSDSFSNGFVYGYSLTLEGGTYSLRNLLLNCLTDKVGWCRRFGIFIEQEEWDTADFLPGTIVSDMGGEYQSYTFSQITELGITLINLPPLRPELKSIVERSFQLIQTSMKPALFDYGFVDKDYGKRLAKDSRKEAVLTLREYEKCVIYGLDSFEYKRRKQQELETAVSEKKAAVENLEDRQKELTDQNKKLEERNRQVKTRIMTEEEVKALPKAAREHGYEACIGMLFDWMEPPGNTAHFIKHAS